MPVLLPLARTRHPHSARLPALRRPVGTGLAVLALAAVLSACSEAPAQSAPRNANLPEVGVVTVGRADAPLEVTLPGRLMASQMAEIRPQVSGIVLRRLFTEGARVSAGQPLYQLDAAAFEAEHARAAAALQKAEAVREAQAVRAARDAELLRADAVSRQVADDSAAALKQADADVAVARAALAAARVQLDRARITAPISGRIDVSAVTPGALVTANQATALTTIQQLDPMHVDIVQSSTEMLQLRQQLKAQGEDASASRKVQLVLEDGSVHPQPATLQFTGVTVDRGTGAVTLRATVPNPQGTLLPGMVVRARVVAGVQADAILVPQQGVSRSPRGDATALVVGEGGKVERRNLVVTRAVGNQWLVASGLQPGDRLIVEGLQRARPGQTVTAVPAGTPGRARAAAAAGPAASAAPATARTTAPAASAR